MSFSNPINQIVTRYSSKDPSAPQINYAVRAVGDIKSILKACLVTGYGTKSGAGWIISDEVGAVCTFASPSVLMSNHKLKIDDDRASDTKWYEIYQDGVPVSMGAAISKSNSAINTSNAGNGWDLLVTECGFLFIENMYNTGVSTVGSRITYFGQMKSGLLSDGGRNIAWWCVGHNAPADNQGMPAFFFDATRGLDKYYKIGSVSASDFGHPNINQFKSLSQSTNVSDIDLASEWYVMKSGSAYALQPGILLQLKSINGSNFIFKDDTIDGRPVMYRWPIRGSSDSSSVLITSHAVAIIYLDYWEY